MKFGGAIAAPLRKFAQLATPIHCHRSKNTEYQTFAPFANCFSETPAAFSFPHVLDQLFHGSTTNDKLPWRIWNYITLEMPAILAGLKQLTKHHGILRFPLGNFVFDWEGYLQTVACYHNLLKL
jgi:hypothetical protein